MNLISIDLFSGCGGLSEGMHQAGFRNMLAFEIDAVAAETYRLNHPKTLVIRKDIRQVTMSEVKKLLGGRTVDLLAGCPPCQGFSTVRCLNRSQPVTDERNDLILEYVRFVKALRPHTIMMENVPGLMRYDLFSQSIKMLQTIGYKWIDYRIVNVKNYGVPQNRKRLVVIGSRLGEIKIPEGCSKRKTVRDAIGNLPLPAVSDDSLHRVFPTHSPYIQKRIELTPKDGGSRKDLPKRYLLDCHANQSIGFNDIYGRLRWDEASGTITGGCLKPSKGRFLHPEQNRCISAREAALLQSFPADYQFPTNVPKDSLALLIGNALPPQFSYMQSVSIYRHLVSHLGERSVACGTSSKTI